MVFHEGNTPGRKKSGIGRKHKKGKTYHTYQSSIEAAGPAGLGDPDPADPDPAEPPPGKKSRPDDNWRVARVVVSRDKKVERISSKRDDLAKNNVALTKTFSQ